MADEKRVIDGYEVINSLYLADSELIYAVNTSAEYPYMVCDCKRDNPLGIQEYINAIAGDDPVEMLQIFSSRVSDRIQSIEAERTERGIPSGVLGRVDCDPESMKKDFTGQAVVIKAESLSPEYHSIDHQLALCTHGNGARPDALGHSVFCETLYDGSKLRLGRSDIAGIVLPDRLPDWAREKLAALQKPAEKESVLDKIRQSEAEQSGKKSTHKKHNKGGPEL